ncbi:MAG TPA: TonB-dependent receptor, partial [Longimicrobiales bacterium]|nr:TonB-dependent receptor [Longimicrobiales bacterium]
EKLSMEFGFGIVETRTQLPRNDNDIYGYLGGAFLGDPRTLGGPKDGWYGNNRPAEVIALYENVDKTTRFNPRLSMSYSPMQWFTNRIMVGGDMTRTEAYQFWAKNDIGFWDAAPLNTGQIGEARRAEDRFTLEYLGNVTHSLNDDLRLDLAFGSQAQTRRSDLTNVTGQGLVTNETRSVNAAAEVLSGGQSSSQDRSIGVFSQLTVAWREKLYLQLGGRRDQASSFGAESKPYYQPKIGLSYVISEEDYFRNLTGFLPDNAITQLRLRGAWGVTGRQPSSGARSTYSPTTNQITPTTVGVGVNPGATGNPNIRPEKGEELELGFDASFVNDRLGLEFTYFNKKTTDQILTLPVAASQGSSGPQVNIGSLLNKGIEVAANARLLTMRNVALEVRGAANTLHNELLDLGGVPESATRKPGFALNGVWQYGIRNVDLASNIVTVSDTLEFLGNAGSLPGWDISGSSTLTLFENLSFYMQLDGRGDFVVYNNTDQFRDRQFGNTEVNVLGAKASKFGALDADGNPTEAARIAYMRRYGCDVSMGQGCTATGAWTTETWVDEDGVTRGGRKLSRTQVSGDYIEDGQFLRLREAAINYRIPNRIVQQYMRARSASIGLTMRNLHMWTDFTGLDPEVGYGDNQTSFLTVPQDKRWTVRFLFTF